jgi:hypothetical protein
MKNKLVKYIVIPIMLFGAVYGSNIRSNHITGCDNPQAIVLKELIVCDTTVYSIFQKIIQTERSNNVYFNDKTVFGIWVEESIENESLLLTITGSANQSILLQIGDVKGFIKYRGYFFFLMTECTKLFIDSSKHKTFHFDPSVEIYDDDRWPFHYIKYYNKTFHFIENLHKGGN